MTDEMEEKFAKLEFELAALKRLLEYGREDHSSVSQLMPRYAGTTNPDPTPGAPEPFRKSA
ncbi:MAG: hypothetical protein JWN93_3202 [Hyphomicrobiales bacterium]|nr:hypothetical protein [Hyphomicrobiales bacterium]